MALETVANQHCANLLGYMQMSRMEKCVSSLKRTFSTIRTGRASPDMLDRIEVHIRGESFAIASLSAQRLILQYRALLHVGAELLKRESDR